MDREALLIVDVQHGFLNQHTQHVIPIIEKMIHQYHSIIATRFFNEANSNFRKLLHWNEMDYQSDGFALALNLPEHAIIIDKPYYTCVTPSFIDYLKKNNLSRIHICGIDTDICVSKCAVDLFENGYTPVVLGFASASTGGPSYHEMALQILIRYIGKEQVIIKNPR